MSTILFFTFLLSVLSLLVAAYYAYQDIMNDLDEDSSQIKDNQKTGDSAKKLTTQIEELIDKKINNSFNNEWEELIRKDIKDSVMIELKEVIQK